MRKLFCIIFLTISISAAAQHTATVTFTDSPDKAANPTLSYQVYRAVAACSTNPTFTKIGSTILVSPFVDSTVTVGNTYCYRVTAVLNNVESPPSNSAQGIVGIAPPTVVNCTTN